MPRPRTRSHGSRLADARFPPMPPDVTTLDSTRGRSGTLCPRRASVAYRYDVFISYARAGDAGLWVKKYFAHELYEKLSEELPYEPRMFRDESSIPVGAYWPDEIREAMRDSKVMVCVLSSRYFRSGWCRSEWASML